MLYYLENKHSLSVLWAQKTKMAVCYGELKAAAMNYVSMVWGENGPALSMLWTLRVI